MTEQEFAAYSAARRFRKTDKFDEISVRVQMHPNRVEVEASMERCYLEGFSDALETKWSIENLREHERLLQENEILREQVVEFHDKYIKVLFSSKRDERNVWRKLWKLFRAQ